MHVVTIKMKGCKLNITFALVVSYVKIYVQDFFVSIHAGQDDTHTCVWIQSIRVSYH